MAVDRGSVLYSPFFHIREANDQRFYTIACFYKQAFGANGPNLFSLNTAISTEDWAAMNFDSLARSSEGCLRSLTFCSTNSVRRCMTAGAIRIFFSHKSIRRMEQAFGHQPVTLFSRYFRAYKVESVGDGAVITRGWRTGRMNRN